MGKDVINVYRTPSRAYESDPVEEPAWENPFRFEDEGEAISPHENHALDVSKHAATYVQPTSPLSNFAAALAPAGSPTAFTGPNAQVPYAPKSPDVWNSSAAPQRPPLERRTTYETRYMTMLLSQDKISRWHNMCAHFFTWILLAGFLVFPATFTTLSLSVQDSNEIWAVLNKVASIPFLAVAAASCGLGIVGMIWLWIRHRNNYIWLINRIFLPGFTNALAGLISTLVNVYTTQHGIYSVTATTTTAVTSGCALVLALLFLVYHYWALSRIRATHDRETEQAARDSEKDDGLGGGIVSTVMNKVHNLDKQGCDPLSIV